MLNVERKVSDFGILFEVVGIIDYSNIDVLKAEYNKLEGKKITKLVFNLENVTYIDSSGIGVLVSFANLVNKYNGRIGLIGIRPEIKKTFLSTKLLNLFEVFDDLASLKTVFS